MAANGGRLKLRVIRTHLGGRGWGGDDEGGPFDHDDEYLKYAIEVLCVLLKGLAAMCHIHQIT